MPQPTTAPIKDENRERFVAFSFAASDLLLEVNTKQKIHFAAGKADSLTGYSAAKLNNKTINTLFDDNYSDMIYALIKGAKKSGRSGPILVSIKNNDTGNQSKAMMMAMSLPDNDHVFLTLNATRSFLEFLASSDYQDSKLLDEKQFEASAIKAFQNAKKNSENLDVTFIEADKIDDYKKSMSHEEAVNFTDNLQMILKQDSYNGNTASQVDGNRYCVVHGEEISSTEIEDKIKQLVQRTSSNQGLKETQNIALKTKTVEADMEQLSEREARRAMIYTINQIEEKGLDSVNEDLSKSFDDYLQENADKITSLKRLIGQQDFKLNFQPIIFIPSEEICHYEALVRFDKTNSPFELITFGEDVGIAPDIDMAILKQAIGYIQHAIQKDDTLKIAVNISGQSIQSEEFFSKMIELLDETKCSPDNLMFEITESTNIGDLEQVNEYLQLLRKRNFEICLDDFGAGAASFQYLNSLDIDCVKIDGKYVRDAIVSPRDEAMVRNLARMCQDLNITTVAEMVETEEQLAYLIDIGVNKAQGWLFGKPTPRAEYTKR